MGQECSGQTVSCMNETCGYDSNSRPGNANYTGDSNDSYRTEPKFLENQDLHKPQNMMNTNGILVRQASQSSNRSGKAVPSNVITDMKVVKKPVKKKNANESLISGIINDLPVNSARIVALRLDLASNPQKGEL